MMTDKTVSPLKKTIKRKKAPEASVSDTLVNTPVQKEDQYKPIFATFSELLTAISKAKTDFEELQKEIIKIKDCWHEEQRIHEQKIRERDMQEEISCKREQETYEYETALANKKSEDEFREKRAQWERELELRKEELDDEKKELESLRCQVANFEAEKQKAVKDSCSLLEKDLTSKYTNEKKLREQEIKAEKELLQLKIQNYAAENTRLTSEIEALKKAVQEATDQVKDIAVKVIESGSKQAQNPQVATTKE